MTAEQLAALRTSTDHDVRRAIAGLVALGAIDEEVAAGTLRLTPLAEWVLRSRFGAVAPGDQIAQLKTRSCWSSGWPPSPAAGIPPV